MSRRRREAMEEPRAAGEQTNGGTDFLTTGKKQWWRNLNVPQRWLVIGLIAFLSLGVTGAGLKYLEDSAREEKVRRQRNPLAVKNDSLLASVNPFLPAPPPSPTPQLSKEYIYAGSRLLAVEDAAANAIPPADLAVWRPSNGTWYCLGGTGSQGFQVAWGTNGDKAAPGDYDGDGKTDLAIFRPSTGTWWIVPSGGGSYYTVSLGTTNDLVASADFDGDGKTDPAVFRPSTQYWYIVYSSGGSGSAQFGATTDQPAAADYDGDGRADIATWRNSALTFYIYSSSLSQQLTQTVGSSGNTYVPAPGDFDGDGKADHALFSADGAWVIKKSSNGGTDTVGWGMSGDIAVQNDYDADGKTDIAIWRPSTGTWWIVNSHDASWRVQQWGQNGDTPVPALYRR